MTWFRVWIEINLVFVSEGIENYLFLEGYRKSLDISVGIEIDLAFVWGIQNGLGFSVGIEVDMFFVQESKLTRFLCPGRK